MCPEPAPHYELGGMTVMHDPSGCNSTYNTHDEIRWYDQDSLIYISGLSERDAIFGKDDKFVDDIIKTAGELNPGFIALAGSPVPYLTGTDLTALAKVIERKSGIPAFAVPTNGMHDYVSGAGMALRFIAERLVIPEIRKAGTNGIRNEKHSRKVNLLGVTPLDFGPASNSEKLCENLEKSGWKVNTVWAMGQTLEDLIHSDEAEANLVVSSTGLSTAELMWEELHIPYVIGTPLGSFTGSVCESLEKVIDKVPQAEQDMPVAYLDDRFDGHAEITLIGEPVTACSMAALIERELKRAARVICPLEKWKGLLSSNDLSVKGEEELMQVLSSTKISTKILAADPLYRPVCPEGCRFVEIPHIAFSGRIYAEKLSDLNRIIEEIGGM